MTYDPCAHVNGATKTTYVHHRVLGRLRPRGHHAGPISKPIVKPVDPGIDAGCRRNVVLSKKTTLPSVVKRASALAVSGVAYGPPSPPIYVTPPTPTTPVTPIIPNNPPGHSTPPTSVPEPASLFLLLAGVAVLMAARRWMGNRAPTGLPA